MLKIAAISDLHLGEPDSALNNRYPKLITEFAKSLNELASRSEPREIETLIVMGDFVDYTLASYHQCHTNSVEFFDAILTGKFNEYDIYGNPTGRRRNCAKTVVRNIVLLPGNHDHCLWRDMVDCLLGKSSEHVHFAEGKYPLCHGKFVFKDKAHCPADKCLFIPYTGRGFMDPVEIKDRRFLYVEKNATGRDTGMFRRKPRGESADKYKEIKALEFLISEKALAELDGFFFQNPHYYCDMGQYQCLFQHGHMQKEIVVGQARFDRAKRKQNFINREKLKALAGDLGEYVGSVSRDQRKKERSLKEIDRFVEAYTIRKPDPFIAKSLLELEEFTAPFIETFWKEAGNDKEPLNDDFWNHYGLLKAIGASESGFGGRRKGYRLVRGFFENFRDEHGWKRHNLAHAAKYYLDLCNETKGHDSRLLFVFGDTHKPMRDKRLHPEVFSRDVSFYNTGVWHTLRKGIQPKSELFHIDGSGKPGIKKIEFSHDALDAIRPFFEVTN